MSSDNFDNNNGEEFEVGYKKPPQGTRFGEPGGNKRRNGRPKGSRNKKLSMSLIQSYAMQEATKPVKLTEGAINGIGGEVTYLPKIQVLYRRLFNAAATAKSPQMMRLAFEQIEKLTSQSDKERHEVIMGFTTMIEKVSRSKANPGSLEHLNTLSHYFMFRKDIRRIEGDDIWIYEDDEPRTEEDWHYFDNLHNQLIKGDIDRVEWPPKYPSEIEAEEWCKQKENEFQPDLFDDF